MGWQHSQTLTPRFLNTQAFSRLALPGQPWGLWQAGIELDPIFDHSIGYYPVLCGCTYPVCGTCGVGLDYWVLVGNSDDDGSRNDG